MGIPSSCRSFRWAALLTPRAPSSSISRGVYRGWLQQVLVKQPGKVTLASDRCCRRRSPWLLNRNTLKALCSMPWWMFLFRWQFRLVSQPTTWSSSSTRIHASSSRLACVGSRPESSEEPFILSAAHGRPRYSHCLRVHRSAPRLAADGMISIVIGPPTHGDWNPFSNQIKAKHQNGS